MKSKRKRSTGNRGNKKREVNDKPLYYPTPKHIAQAIGGTHCGFALKNQLPLYRLDDLKTVQL